MKLKIEVNLEDKTVDTALKVRRIERKIEGICDDIEVEFIEKDSEMKEVFERYYQVVRSRK